LIKAIGKLLKKIKTLKLKSHQVKQGFQLMALGYASSVQLPASRNCNLEAGSRMLAAI
jgi:hypothetical protein